MESTRPRWKPTIAFVALAWLSTGCSGTVTDSGTGASDGPPDVELPDECSMPASGSPARRLNRDELAYAVEDVLGVSGAPMRTLPRDGTVGGFATVGSQLSSGELFSDQFIDASLATADEFVASGALGACTDAAALAACVERELAPALRLLYRRAATADELAALGELADRVAAERGTADGLSAAVAAALSAPSFLFALPDQPVEQPRRLTGTELATRLALALWSSVPDDELLDHGLDGTLLDSDVYQQQVDRMMTDARFERFDGQFFASWFNLEKLDNVGVNFDALGVSEERWANLVRDMRTETSRFVADVFDRDAPIEELFSADYTFVNRRLASHYGLPGADELPDGFSRVEFPADSDRSGLFTHGSVLAQAAAGDHASVVLRGELVLAGFLCQPPPPPPDSLADEIEALDTSGLSEREKMAVRAENEACVGCHALLDPIGWGFSGFDALGRPTDLDDVGNPSDPSGALDGSPFDGAAQLASLLAERDRYATCMAEKALIFASGRAFNRDGDPEDRCFIDALVDEARRDDGGSPRAILRAILRSPLFLLTGPDIAEDSQ